MIELDGVLVPQNTDIHARMHRPLRGTDIIFFFFFAIDVVMSSLTFVQILSFVLSFFCVCVHLRNTTLSLAIESNIPAHFFVDVFHRPIAVFRTESIFTTEF